MNSQNDDILCVYILRAALFLTLLDLASTLSFFCACTSFLSLNRQARRSFSNLNMKLTSSALFFLTNALPLVSGHYVFSTLIVDGKSTQEYEYIRKNSNGYQPTLASDILNNDFRCNSGSMTSATNTKVYQVAPGPKSGSSSASAPP